MPRNSASRDRRRRAAANALGVGGGLWLDRQGRQFLGAGRIALLESIERCGSITQAAKDVGLSYKAAWDAVDAMNNLAERPLLVRAAGGQNGGGSRLTDHGRQLTQLYRLLESGYQRLLRRMQSEVGNVEQLTELIRSIALKTSARNQFRGTVKAVRKGSVNADVILDIGDGLEIFANITNEAVEDLRLKRGSEAIALIKSSFVLLSCDPQVRVSARNRLRGSVLQIIPGSVNSEVRIALTGSRVLTAIVSHAAVGELALRTGCEVCALVKDSHVLLAVND